MSWASLLKAGGKAVKWAGRGAGRVLETGGKALLHPQQTLKGAGTAIKSGSSRPEARLSCIPSRR